MVKQGPLLGPLIFYYAEIAAVFAVHCEFCVIIAENYSALKKFKFLLLSVTWLIISTILLTLPGSSFPREDWADDVWLDKWIHMGMFFLLVWLWCLALRPYYTNQVKRKKVFVQVFAAAVLYGIAMEFVQRYWVINRSFDTGDIIADAAGSALGLWFCVGRYIKK